MTTWTVETVQALAKEFMEASKKLADRMELRPEQLAGQFYKYDAASALTWALERIAKVEKDLIEARDDFRALRLDKDRIEAERDAANARAESARVDALEEAASYVDTIPPRYPDRQDQYCKGAGETAECIDDCIRALKEAGK